MGKRLFLRSEVEDFKEEQIALAKKVFVAELAIALICWSIGGVLVFISVILVIPLLISFFFYLSLINKDNDYWEEQYSKTWKNLSDKEKVKTVGKIIGVLFRIFG